MKAIRPGKYPIAIHSRVSVEEFEKIQENAEVAGMSLCKYIRHRVCGHKVSSAVEIRTIAELLRLGGLFKKAYSEGHPTGQIMGEISATLSHLRKIC
jgi:hypothetical protein